MTTINLTIQGDKMPKCIQTGYCLNMLKNYVQDYRSCNNSYLKATKRDRIIQHINFVEHDLERLLDKKLPNCFWDVIVKEHTKILLMLTSEFKND